MSDPSQPLGSPRPEVPRITVPEQGSPVSPQSSTLGPADESIKPASRSGKPFLEVPGADSRGNSIDEKNVQSPTSSNGGTTIVHASAAEISDEEALRPDPGTEEDFTVEDNRFAFTPGELNKMINPKSMPALKALGGLKGLEYGLRTNVTSGLSLDETLLDGNVSIDEARMKLNAYKGKTQEDAIAPEAPSTPDDEVPQAQLSEQAFADRIRIYKRNTLPEKKAKSIFLLMWIALQDKVLILLSAAAVISLALGIYQTIQAQKRARRNPNSPESKEAHVEWVEGVAIIVAVLIVVVVGAGNDWQKERQFVKLNKKKEDRTVKAMRSGKAVQISVYDILVGDILYLEPGDMIPADGVFVSGHNVKCDESSATGEIDQIKKTPADECMVQMMAGANIKKLDPFILSGGKVLEGVGTYLVTSVGVNSSHGKIMMALREDVEATPLQVKLNGLAEGIAKIGGAAALLLFVVLLIKFLANLKNFTGSADEKAQRFIQILITAITIVVVAVPEGLPLAVTLALAFATTRMLRDNNLVRVLRSCETMGNATTVCSDKTGTLTQNKMTVVAGVLGKHFNFGAQSEGIGKKHNEMPMNEINSKISDEVKTLLLQSIAVNCTAFEGEEDGKPAFIGSKTETALLSFARDHLGMGPLAHEKSSASVAQLVPFDSARKCMAVVVKLPSGKYRLYVKGASEILLKQTSKIVADPSAALSEVQLSGSEIEAIEGSIVGFAKRSLRTIGLVYRDFTEWPPRGARLEEDDPRQAVFSDIFREMTFLCLVGIQDPLRPGVPEAVRQCQKAGVFVRMVTGDNVITAKAIATECGIYTEGGLVMEGPDFRRLNKSQMRELIPRLQVLARSSPEDKQILVRNLKEMGETVAVTGDGTNDGPALKMADIGFSMGIAGTEVAKEASAIILMDDNFSSIVKALMWGRAVNDAVKKFLQFQLTVNITAVLLAFVTAVASDDEQPVLRAVQLLWVNLIMDTFAALALATDPPPPDILNRPPQRKSAPLITVNMWKMIIGQAIYQLVVTFVLHFAGGSILGYDLTQPHKREELSSLVFNTFVWMQIFNQYNNRRLDNKFNIFEGLHRNWFFIFINVIMVGGQVMIIFVGGAALRVVRLDGPQWAISLILGAISLLIGVVIRLIPDPVFKKILPKAMYRDRKTPDLFVSDDEHRFEWNQGIEDIRHELQFIKMIRGGRLNTLKFKTKEIKHRLLPLSKSSSHQPPGSPDDNSQIPPPSPSSHRRKRSRSNSAFAAAAMVPSIVAGSVGGWSPIEKPAEGGDRGFPIPVSREPSQVSKDASDPSVAQAEKPAPATGTRTPPDTSGGVSNEKP
ncbi:Calcium-transporting ATPase 10, plasma membrane-type [Orbilia oligospora]|uniref:Calcium-transporting ATPase n=1 Tax=Orbilia oligospora TaxID=2813651 RepID=A0A7C8P3T7_ORBOL|nr:Calcium-transporting ATPase 10, plasma membrane-type [Orbilia oligospora]TGJ69397.1 Calcium-transporting ATPase 10, plasma membrane-type [Orbilia oligospora]